MTCPRRLIPTNRHAVFGMFIGTPCATTCAVPISTIDPLSLSQASPCPCCSSGVQARFVPLPSTHLEVLLGEVGRDHGPVGKLPASQGLESLRGRLWGVVLDINLAHAGRLPTAANWSGNLDFHNLAVLGALLPYVVTNFCQARCQQACPNCVALVSPVSAYLRSHRYPSAPQGSPCSAAARCA